MKAGYSTLPRTSLDETFTLLFKKGSNTSTSWASPVFSLPELLTFLSTVGVVIDVTQLVNVCTMYY